jgi:elongation factor 1 alpha-like protein
VKNVGYDDDDFEDDDGYDSPDPEEQEFLQQCTAAVLGQLRAGQPSVTATTEEVQESLWHYYNDIEKTVNYLRGMYISLLLLSFLLERALWVWWWGCVCFALL